MTDRLPCVVDGCRHTMGHAAAIKRWGHVPAEWVCQRHWSRLTKAERRVWTRTKRRIRRLGFDPAPEVSARLWRGLVRRASS